MNQSNQRTLGAILYEDFEPLDLYGPIEMFGLLAPELKIVTVAEEPGAVGSFAGVKTIAEFGFDECPSLNLILLPGGIGSSQQVENSALLGFLRDRTRSAEITMSVCTGSAILAKAGLLDGRHATSNKQLFKHATDQSDKVHWVAEARWVEDGPYVTSSGVSAGTDMALAVISRLYGRERAEQIAAFAEYSWQSEPHKDPFHKYLNHGDLQQLLVAFGRA